MEDINIISLGNFKINNRDFFKKILNVKEIDRKKLRSICGGEQVVYKNFRRNLKYINNHFIIDNLNLKDINHVIKKVLSNRGIKEKYLIIYFIDKFNEENFNESLSIIKEFSQNYDKNFLLIYIDNENNQNDKKFLGELDNILKVKKIFVKGNSFNFDIEEEKRFEFGKFLTEIFLLEEKNDILEKFSAFCIQNIYNASIENENLNSEDIVKFKLDIEDKLIKDVNLFNEKVQKLSEEFKISSLDKIELIKKEEIKNIKFDKSPLGVMAKQMNKKDYKTLREKVFIKLKIKKGCMGKNNELKKKLINEAFIQKQRIEKSFELYKIK